MGIKLDGSKWVLNTSLAPIPTGTPIVMACLHYPFVFNTAQTMVSLAQNTVGGNYFELFMSTTGQDAAQCFDGTSSSNINGTAVTVPGWRFVVGRFLSSTIRNVDILHLDTGALTGGTHASGTTSVSPTSITRAGIGARANSTETQQYQGIIAEAWILRGDIPGLPSSTAAMPFQLLYQLAWKGPFSYPALVPNIVEYKSLRQAGDTSKRIFGNNFEYSTAGPRTWSDVLPPVQTSFHPPIRYDLPNRNKRFGIV